MGVCSYKEQVSTTVPKSAILRFCPCGKLVGECLPQTLLCALAAVSYTHLDVYTRQVLQHRAEITDGKYLREAVYGLKEPPQEETVEIIRMSEVDTCLLYTSRLSGRSWKFPFLNNSAGRWHFLLSPLDCLPAKAGGAVNCCAYAPFILTVDWLGWVCYLPDKLEFILSYHVLPS